MHSVTLRRSLMAGALLLLLVISQAVQVQSSARAGTRPPETGDWFITNVIRVENETVTVNGNLLIRSSGALILENVTLIMNCKSENQFGIEVEGALELLDSRIMPQSVSYPYWFNVSANASFSMKRTRIERCGRGDVYRGLTIEANNVSIEDSEFAYNNYGLYLINSHGSRISNCTIYGNANHGLKIANSHNITVENCSMYGNQQGIYLYATRDTHIIGSSSYSNRGNGIYLHGAGNNAVRDCMLYDNELYGIRVDDGAQNTFYHNSLYGNDGAGNEHQARGNGKNHWDYNGRGNYWGDYVGRDIDGDGVGDWAYDKLAMTSNKDKYPLVAPTRGPWMISGMLDLWNQTLVQTGDVVLAETSYLALHNVTLEMNCESGSAYHIDAQGGSELYIYSGSVITSTAPEHHYLFRVRDGVRFEMRDSELHRCGSAFDTESENRGLWVNTDNAVLDNATFSNNGLGVMFYNAENCSVVNSTFSENYLGIYLDSASNNIISDCNISRNDYMGINLIDSSNNNTLMGSNVSYNPYGSILETNRDNSFSNCSFYANGHVGLEAIDVTSARIEDCEFASTSSGIFLLRATNISLTNNTIYDNRWGITLEDSSYCTMRGNRLRDNSVSNLSVEILSAGVSGYAHTIDETNTINDKPVHYYYGLTDTLREALDTTYIMLAGCVNVTLRDCAVRSGESVFIRYTQNSTIMNCTITDNRLGISSAYSTNNTITNCTIGANDIDGISLFQSQFNDISYNAILGNQYGITLTDASYNAITSCIVSGNSADGISLYGSDYNTVSDCVIRSNNAALPYLSGVYLKYSSNNAILRCEISDNGNGIRIYNNANHNTISYCEIAHNTHGGIALSRSRNIALEHSSLYGNGQDIEVRTNSELACLNATFDRNSTYVQQSTLTVSHYLTLDVFWNATPVEAARVTIHDALGNLIFNGTTDENGEIPRLLVKAYVQTAEGLTEYAPYKITTCKNGLGNTTTLALTRSMPVTLILSPIAPESERGPVELQLIYMLLSVVVLCALLYAMAGYKP